MGKSWNEYSNELIKLAKKEKIPLTGQFELTARCNFKCKMCYVCHPVNDRTALDGEKSAKDWIRLAEEARDSGMLYLLLTGGEVFLRKDFKTIYENIAQMGFHISIYTNASMITPKIVKWLQRTPPSKVEVTLYGASPETYEDVCGEANGFDRTIRGIDLLINEGIALELRTTIIKRNLKDFYKLTELAERRKLEFGFVNYISPRRELNNTYPEKERLSPEKLAEFEMLINKHFRKNNSQIVGKGEIDKKLKEEVSNTCSEQYGNNPFRCSAGNCAFWVTWDGSMTPCALMNEPASYPFKTSFADAWEELNYYCHGLTVPKECVECSLKDYCLQCPGRLKVETGCYDKPAPYLCELAQNRKSISESKERINI